MAPVPLGWVMYLQVGLKECPFVNLDAVVNFEHGCIVRLIDISLLPATLRY